MDPPGPVRAFEIPADVDALGWARREMIAAIDALGWDDQEAGRVLLAGNEAVSNAIEHGSPAAGAIGIVIESRDDQLVMTIRDEGRPGGAMPVTPDREPPPDHIRGRGLLIMSRLADSVVFSPRQPSGTEVTLAFRPVAAIRTPAARIA